MLNTNRPLMPHGELGGGGRGTYSKVLGSCQEVAPVGTELVTRWRIRLGTDLG